MRDATGSIAQGSERIPNRVVAKNYTLSTPINSASNSNKGIVTLSAVKEAVTLSAVEGGVTLSTGKEAVTLSAVEGGGTLSAVEGIVTLSAVEGWTIWGWSDGYTKNVNKPSRLTTYC